MSRRTTRLSPSSDASLIAKALSEHIQLGAGQNAALARLISLHVGGTGSQRHELDSPIIYVAGVKEADYTTGALSFKQATTISTTTGALTLGAITLSGTVSGGGQQVNNVIVGTVTPLAGFFTTGNFTGVVTHATYSKHLVVQKTAIADNVATGLFTITTTNETGNNDAGSYLVKITLLVSANNTVGAFDANVGGGIYQFGRAMSGDGDGANSAVVEVSEITNTGTGGGTNPITAVTVTVTETSEYVMTVNVTVDYTQTDANIVRATAWVELLYDTFTTAPVLAAL